MELSPNFQGKDSHIINDLLNRLKVLHQIESDVKSLLPANLRPLFRVSVGQNNTIVIFTDNTMVANRLKMLVPSILPSLHKQYNDIIHIQVKLRPDPKPRIHHTPPPTISKKNCDKISNTSSNLSHHPTLASALEQLANKHILK